MNYFKLDGFQYEDNPNDSTIYFGQDAKSIFIHQVIEDPEMPPIDVSVAAQQTNATTEEYASTSNFSIAFGEPEEITIAGNRHVICEQVMTLEDGRSAVQQNIYFFDADDGMFRMVQFGTVPLPTDIWSKQGEALKEYTSRAIRQILNNMAMPAGMLKVPIKRFIPA